MSLQPRWQMVQLMALLAFTAAAWMIAVTARAAGPSEAILAPPGSLAQDDGEADAGVEPEEAPEADAKPPEYVVQPGDSLSEIAEAHGIRTAELVAANGISDPDDVHAGAKLKIPGAAAAPKKVAKRPKALEGVRITVPKGVTLSRIAEIYDIPWKRIAKANGLGATGRVRAGQKLLIPGASKILEIVPCLKPPVTLYRVRTDETRTVSLCRCNGEPTPEGIEVLSAVSAPPRQPVPFPLHERLVRLLQRVAEQYPGKRLEIVSGQRPRKESQKNESLHNKGRAIDFRVEGVSNARLVTFVRKLDQVGVGYYPNSVFIHLDTREKDAYWIDYSRPGEKAIYGKAGMKAEEIEKIRLARKAAATESPEAPATEAETDVDVEATVDVGTLADLVQAAVAESLASPAEAPAEAEAKAAPPIVTPIAVNVVPEG
ncbi:MAG: LysM peptidoglycan-binding domain-containing protein [Proteobacteria bacterium]|nr:LysM peptidoglycan-binding domain-containing protein [Pseudomonadota bacterium]